MVPSLKPDGPASPCCFTHSELPDYIDKKQPPARRPPFSTILAHPCAHTLDLILPDELWQLVEQHITSDAAKLAYSKVHMSPLEIISGDFFNHHIKTGNILMVSEGRPHIDNRFSIRDGVFRLEVDKPTYERCGLVGHPIQGLGRKHVKSRYLVELNLRLPSMVRGKKGFDRIVYAFTQVLTDSLTWLFIDLQPHQAEEKDIAPIKAHHPEVFALGPTVTRIEDTIVPIVRSKETIADHTYQEDLLEWLGLVLMESPRLRADEKIDSHLCRYQLPEAFIDPGPEDAMPQDLVHVRWQGLIPAKFVTEMLLVVREAQGGNWVALAANDFEAKAYTVLCLGEREVLSWVCG